MKKSIIIIAVISFILGSCSSERSEYFKGLTQDGEIIVNFTNNKGKEIELYWSFIKGEVDDYKTNYNVLGYGPGGSWDCRLIRLTNIGPFRIEIESPKNEPALQGEDYYYEVELKFEPPHDLTKKEYQVEGTIYVIGHNAAGDGGDISDSYDAVFQIFNYTADAEAPEREAVTVKPEDMINEMKNIFDQEAEVVATISDGSYCFQLDDLSNSGDFYYCNMTVENGIVKGEITVENEASESYTINFNGTVGEETLSVETTYSNDGGGPYKEDWKLNTNNLILEQPAVTLTNIKCD